MGMTLAEVHSRVRSLLNDQGQQVFGQTEITNFVNDWMAAIGAECHAFEKTTAFSTVAQTRTYNLSSDFVGMKWVLYNLTTTLREVTHNQLKNITWNPISRYGTPLYYYLERTPSTTISTVLGLYPVPSASSESVRYWYYYVPANLSSMTDRIPLPPGWDDSCVYYVCEKMKLKDREFGEAQKFRAMYESEKGKLDSMLTASPNIHRRMGRDSGADALIWPGLDPSRFANP